MKPLFLLLFIPLLFILNFWFKKKNDSKKPSIDKTKEEYLNEIRLCDKYEIEGYRGKTKMRMVSLQDRANALVDIWLEPHHDTIEIRETSDQLLQDAAQLTHDLKSGASAFEQCQTLYEQKIEQINSFFDDKNFYPPDFTFLANTLHEKYNTLKETKRKDPLFELKDFNDFLTLISTQFDTFDEIHSRVSMALLAFDEKKDSFTEPKLIPLLELKQKIFFSLHQGNFKETENLIRVFSDRMKNEEEK